MKKTDEEIKAFLDDAIRSAEAYDSSGLSQKRADAINYLKGVMDDVPAQAGKSSVVSRDLAVIIGWMLPGIIKIFTGSGRICDFEPADQKDEEFSEQASDYINHEFMKENDGYRVLWDSIFDSLLFGDGIVKVWWDDNPEYETFMYTGLNEVAVSLLIQDPEVEVLAQDEEIAFGEDGSQMILYDLKISRVKSTGRLRFSAIEPENFLMDKLYCTIEESRFTAHKDVYTRSDLVEMGFDKGVIEGLPTDRIHEYDDEEKLARDGYDTASFSMTDDSVQPIDLYECYIKMDVDGDGIAETVRAYYAGNQGAGELLEWDVWEDEVPFVAIPCEPVPHKFDSNGASDMAMDIQRIKTVLTRQGLDNIYAHNSPQPEFEEGSVLNRDSIISPKPGQPIIRKRGSQPLGWRDIPFVADKTFMAIGHIDNELERRTGVSRATLALDPDALQGQTATAVNEVKAAATSKTELYATNQAQGFAKMLNKALNLIVKNQDRTKTIRLRGNWVEMDPRVWNVNMKCTVNTGLGTGSREKDLIVLDATLQRQLHFMDRYAQGQMIQQAVEMIPKVNQTAIKIAEVSGLNNADSYYPVMNQQVMQQIAQTAQQSAEQPSPEQQKIQSDMELEKARMQMEGQQHQVEHQGKMQIEDKKIEQHIVREREQLQADTITNNQKMEMEAAYQEKELAARREKDQRNYEIDLANIAIKQRELDLKEYEIGLKDRNDLLDLSSKTEHNTDKIDLEYDKLKVMEKKGMNNGNSAGDGS